MLTRRRFLQGSAAGLAGAMLWPAMPTMANPRHVAYIGARADIEGRAFVAGFDAHGAAGFDLPLPARGHGFAQRPDRPNEIAAFARRPGEFVMIVDVRDGRVVRRIDAIENRRFCGHGAFDRTGKLLYTTELEYETGDGIIGVYDAQNGYARTGEFRSGGLDPHEIRLMPDGENLVVANGGILTDPDAPGIKLNIDEMKSSLVYLRARDGEIVTKAELPASLHQLSLRHLALDAAGTVAVVMQYEGPSSDRVPLIALHRPGNELMTLDLPRQELGRLRNYCGSVAVDAAGVLAATSPVGGVTVFWDMGAGRCLGYAEIADGCGVAPGLEKGTFVVTSGQGGGFEITAAASGGVASHPLRSPFLQTGRWDNHLMQLA